MSQQELIQLKPSVRSMAAALLSLALAACSSLPTGQQVPTTRASAPAAQAKLTPHGQASYDPVSRQLRVKVSFGRPEGFGTRSISCSGVDHAQVMLNGIGLGSGLQPNEANPGNGNRVPTSGCGVDISFNNVPVGKARVISVVPMNASVQPIPGAEVLSAFDLGSTALTVDVDDNTSTAALVIKHLAQTHGQRGQYLAAKINLTDLQDFVESITVPVGASAPYSYTRHPSLVNAEAIADALDTADGDLSQLSAADASFLITPHTLGGTIIGNSPPYTFNYRDPASVQQTVSTGSTWSLPVVTPGAWDLEVKDGLNNTQTFPGLSSGLTSQQIAFGVNFPSESWGSLSGPIGGDVHALKRAGSHLYAGTSSGLFRIDSAMSGSWSATGLTGVKVLSLGFDGSTYYAGTESNGLYSSSDGNVWSPVNDVLLNGQTIYRILFANSKIYAATSSGVAELSGGVWSMVNLNFSVANPRITDICFNGSKFAAVAPDENKVYLATDPGSGWTDVSSGLPTSPAFSPVSVTADGSRVFVGGSGGTVYHRPLSAGSWSQLITAYTPGGAVSALAVDTDNSGSPFTRLYAATIGQDAHFINDTPFSSNSLSVIAPGLSNPAVQALESAVVQDDRSGLIAGTQAGVSVTDASAGLKWLAKNSGLDATEINDVVAQGDFLYAATQGGGVQRMQISLGASSWTPLLGAPPDGGKERYPRQLAIDGAGNLYAVHGTNTVIALPSAASASETTSWQSLGTLSETVTDIAAASDNSAVYISSDDGSGNGQIRSHAACNSGCANALSGWTQIKNGEAFTRLAFTPDGLSRLYAGSANGAIYHYSSSTWSGAINGPTCPETGFKVTGLAISVVGSNFHTYFSTQKGGDDGLHHLTDTGAVTCRDMTAVLGEGDIRALEADGSEPNLLFVAGTIGIQASSNATLNAPSFTAFNDGSLSPPLGNQSVNVLRFQNQAGNRRLIAGTKGRGLVKTLL